MNVSVVIPVRNDAVLLRRALAALAAQTRPLDELVIVDNGSTDDTAEVAAAAGARVVSEPIAGIPRAASAGYDAATGDIILRIDADTIVPPTWLGHAAQAFESDPGLDLLTGDAEFYDAGPVTRALGKAWWIGGMYWSSQHWLGHPMVFGSNFGMRRRIWQQLSGEVHRYRLGIHDDVDLSLHVKPWMTVRRDRSWVAGISARPFATVGGIARRVRWVGTSIRGHGSPWKRKALRDRWREEGTWGPVAPVTGAIPLGWADDAEPDEGHAIA